MEMHVEHFHEVIEVKGYKEWEEDFRKSCLQWLNWSPREVELIWSWWYNGVHCPAIEVRPRGGLDNVGIITEEECRISTLWKLAKKERTKNCFLEICSNYLVIRHFKSCCSVVCLLATLLFHWDTLSNSDWRAADTALRASTTEHFWYCCFSPFGKTVSVSFSTQKIQLKLFLQCHVLFD